MGRLNRTARRLTRAIEGAAPLDAVADPLSDIVTNATKNKAVKNGLSGTWLGHQLHPLLTDVPEYTRLRPYGPSCERCRVLQGGA